MSEVQRDKQDRTAYHSEASSNASEKDEFTGKQVAVDLRVELPTQFVDCRLRVNSASSAKTEHTSITAAILILPQITFVTT